MKDIAKATSEEEASVKAYDALIADVDASISSLESTKSDLEGTMADDESSMTTEKGERTTNQENANRLKMYKSKLLVIPRKSKAKKGDATRAEVANVPQNTHKEIIPVPKVALREKA